ncbi:MAG: hypothetical protein GY714_03735 [Desulfobacterales bacterium]|nr:hypothetical protein [Desulfobacterales bacterium]MCP4161818.1 hypothetical protein [Deltaproteobacteria bacterium]
MEAIQLLSKAFYVPLDESYTKEDAQTALKVIELLVKILKELGLTEVAQGNL